MHFAVGRRVRKVSGAVQNYSEECVQREGSNAVRAKVGEVVRACALAALPLMAACTGMRPLAELRQDCAARNDGYHEAADVRFINAGTDSVELFWIDDDGALQSYGALGPGQVRRFNSYIGHAWVARDAGGRVRDRACIVSDRSEYEIQRP